MRSSRTSHCRLAKLGCVPRASSEPVATLVTTLYAMSKYDGSWGSLLKPRTRVAYQEVIRAIRTRRIVTWCASLEEEEALRREGALESQLAWRWRQNPRGTPG